MWRSFLQGVMNARPTKVYEVEGEVLFYRAFLFEFVGWVFYLHHYLRGDPDARGLHDHPARNVAFILAGGYDEERIVGYGRGGVVVRVRRRNPGSLFRVDENVFHRLVLDTAGGQPTSWSLFASKYLPDKHWGFMCNMARPNIWDAVDGASVMLYRESGAGLDGAEPWYRAAPTGKEVCRERISDDRAGQS